MNIYSILQLCGGLAFSFSECMLCQAVLRSSQEAISKILKEVTSNPIKSLFLEQ